jgi:hypothetical protein
MPSRLFLHDATNALTGTFPSAEQSAALTATILAPTANTLRTMNSLTGTAQVVRSITSSATVVAQVGFCAMFCSDTLNVAQVIPPQPLLFNIANRESSASMNIGADMRINAYVWRPSTGTKIGTLVDGLAMVGDAEPSAALSIRVNRASITSTVTLSADAGDVIICEVWNLFTQAVGTSLQCGFYWDGTTVNLTQDAVVTNHASFFELSTSTLTFGTPAVTSISCSFGQTLDTLTFSGVGAITAPGFVTEGQLGGVGWSAIAGTWDDQTLNWDQFDGATLAAATLAATGTSPRNSTFANTLDPITLAATGTVAAASANGTFSNTLAALTLAATGTSPRNASFSNTLADATLAGVGSSPRNASFSNTLATIALSGAASVTLNATFSNTLGAVALAGAGAVPHTSSFANTLGAATLAATGTTPVAGSFNNTLGAIALSATGVLPLAGVYNVTLAPVTLTGAGTVTDVPPVVGQFLNTLTNLQLAATATVLTPVPQPAQRDDGAGSGGARAVQRKKFIVPSVEQVPFVDRMFDDLKPQPMPRVVETPDYVERSTLLVDSLAKMAPKLAPPPEPLPQVEVLEPDDDLDMIMIAMLL